MKGNTVNTLHTLTNRFETESVEHLEDVEVPVLSGPQRQGDIMVIPMKPGQIADLQLVPREGVVVVRGENGGNTHRLMADGDVHYALIDNRGSQRLMSVVVAESATAWLTHPEHGFNGIGSGTYVISRQREQAEQIRLVAD